MNPSVLLLLVSLAANGALVAALVFRAAPPSPAANGAAPAPRALAAAGPASTRPAPAGANVPGTTVWSRLRTDNLDELNRRLRAAGFPPREVRMIMARMIEERTSAERSALVGKPEDTPYWKSTGNATNPELQRRMTEIHRESGALYYKYVSGPDSLVDDEDARIAARRRFGNLPLEKLQQLTALEHDASDLQMQASNNMAGPMSNEARQAARETYLALEREKMAQIAKVLSPAELEQYELRSNQAAGLASRLTAFRPTEEEFKVIYALEKASREASAETAMGIPVPGPALRGDQREAYEAQIVAALGPERAADYLELGKAGSDMLPLLIARLELPLSTLGTINAVRSDINRRASAVLEDRSLTAGQREAQLAALAQEADEKLSATLGSKRGYDAYLDMKGDWVRAIRKRR